MTQKIKQSITLVSQLAVVWLLCFTLQASAAVNWAGVPVNPTTPLAFEDPNNWEPENDPNIPVPSAGPELSPPGEDSIAFIPAGSSDPNSPLQYNGQILLSVPRDGSNGTTNAKLGSLVVGGGNADQVQQLIITTDVNFTGRERDDDTGEIRMSDPNTFDLRELRVGRSDTTPYYVDGDTGSRDTVNVGQAGYDQFPWGYVKQTSGTVSLEYLDDPSQAQLKIAGDKDSSAGGLWEVGGTASLNVGDPNLVDNGITIGFKDVVSPGAIFRVRGSEVGSVNAGNRLVVSSLSASWDTSGEDTFGSIVLAKMNRGKSILEFVLDENGVTPIETTGDLRIGSQNTDPFTLTSKLLYGFLRVKLSEPTTAGSGEDEIVLVRSDRITSAITVITDPNSETGQGVFYDPDRPGPSTAVEHRPILRDDNGSAGTVISDYAGVTYTWEITYFESAGGAIDGEISDAVTLSNLVITGGIQGDFDDLDGLDSKDLDALVAAKGSVSLAESMDSAQNMFDLDGDGLIEHSDVEMWITHPGFLNSAFGDFDLDGDVDGDDLASWDANYGSTSASYSDGDADWDGDVDGFDFFIWQQNYTGAIVSIAAVPEPATTMLISCGLLFFPVRRKNN